MKNKKVVIIAASVLVLLIVGVIVAVIVNGNKSNSNYGNEAYTQCVNEANELADANKKISDQVDAEIKKCTRDFIAAKGFSDNLECVGTSNTDPICESTERYNAEVDGSNQCNENRDSKLKQAGYKTDIIPVIDCMKYLGK